MIKGFKELPKGLKASLAFFCASLVTKGIAYITTPLYTRLMTAEEFGQASVFFTWQSILGIIAMFNLQAGVFNNGMIDYPDKRDDYSFSMLILSNVITIIVSGILIACFPFAKGLLQMEFPFVILMCINFLVQPAYNFWVSRQRYEMNYRLTVLWSIIIAILSPFAAILLLKVTEIDHLYARVFGAETVLIIIYIGFYVHIGKKNSWKLNRDYWKAAVLFNLPLLPHYLSTYLLGSSDKLMISHLIGTSETAYYSVAYSIASVATIIWSAVNSSLIPYTYENCKKRNFRAISDITIPILVIFAGACVVIILLAPEVIAIMATKNYLEAIYVIPPIVGGVFFQVQYYIYANVVYYYKKPTYVMMASVLATVLNLILNYACIPKFGYIAAGYTTLFCYMLQAIIDYWAMQRVVREKVYDMKLILMLSISVVIVSMISNLLYKFTILRYIVLVVMVLGVVFLRKKIMLILMKIKTLNK